MSIVILGATGSIGVNALTLCDAYQIEVEALVAGRNIDLLNEQIRRFRPRTVAIADAADAHKVAHNDVRTGTEGILSLIEESRSEIVLNALVGFAGLLPTLKAIETGKRVALANKESLVAGGTLIDTSRIIPVDSEHFALRYLMNGKAFRKLYITASGGAFRDWELEKIETARFADALKHPNWSMGDKITIDSATMTNKLFELLEAKWLFDTTDVDALIERSSTVHALITYADGSTVAHMASTDMKLPIALALGIEPESPVVPETDPLTLSPLRFEAIDERRYPIWQVKAHLLQHPHLGVVVNAANEVAIETFKKEQCSFFGMSEIVLDAYRHFEDVAPNTIDDIVTIDKEVRHYVQMSNGVMSNE